MKTLGQYLLARIGLWRPMIGSVYRADVNWKPDPFKPEDQPWTVCVVDIKGNFVQYKSADTGYLHSSSIEGFASYFLKVTGK